MKDKLEKLMSNLNLPDSPLAGSTFTRLGRQFMDLQVGGEAAERKIGFVTNTIRDFQLSRKDSGISKRSKTNKYDPIYEESEEEELPPKSQTQKGKGKSKGKGGFMDIEKAS